MDRSHDSLTRKLAECAGEYDRSGEWPTQSLDAVREHGVWRWAIPNQFGGDGLTSANALAGYEAVARGCMSTALIVSQHDAATDLIVTGSNEALKAEICPLIARGELLLTVGISQLTTSHQEGEPSMKVTWDGHEAQFTGLMPWATGATNADMIVTAGVLPDGQQLLGCMRRDAVGVTVKPPMQIMALQSSWTSAVTCKNAPIPASHVIRGPAETVLSIRSPVRPLVVSACGIGLAGAIADSIKDIKARRTAEIEELADSVLNRYQQVREQLFAASNMLNDPKAENPAGEIRATVNDLLMRLMIVMVTMAKGTGYMTNHSAQRLAREALFYLVWSARNPVQAATLRRILGNQTD